MEYKLIAVDMDGTLLNSKMVITEKTAKAIQNVVDKDVIFTIATGRPIQGIEEFISQLQLKGPVITYNGAVIVNAENHEVLFEQNLMYDDAKKIIELGQRYDTTMCIWADGQLYVNKMNDKVWEYEKLSGVEPILAEDVGKLLDIGITKILWYDEVEWIEKVQKGLSQDMFSEVSYCTSQPIFLEFFSSRVSKATAMEKIGELYGIRREEMIAVGDGLNDLDMIRYAGLGVAMGNADEEIKRNAQYITASNDEDGVRKVIEKFF